ncbi:hypothetical protein HDZ31DRAFT_40683 [Schizophyllum fasciatum]
MSTQASLFDVKAQLTFYGAYHSNKVNVGIHMVFVPTIMWTAFAMSAALPTPAVFPDVRYTIGDYLAFAPNWPALYAAVVSLYYFALDPVAAVRAGATARPPPGLDHFHLALALHITSWLFQFAGHGLAEGRAPALLDNLLGAIVLAPFFVHLEALFALGYRPRLRAELRNAVGVEVARIRRGTRAGGEGKGKAE